MSDEQLVTKCGHCGVPILSWWAPNGGGLLRGEYVLLGDVLFHPKCCDEYILPLTSFFERLPQPPDTAAEFPPPAASDPAAPEPQPLESSPPEPDSA